MVISYSIPIDEKNTIVIGNIPLVGLMIFYVFWLVALRLLLNYHLKTTVCFTNVKVIVIEPRFKGDIKLVEKVENFELLYTGSNESFKHFEYYFKGYPLFWKAASVAILTGDESLDEEKLWLMISSYTMV